MIAANRGKDLDDNEDATKLSVHYTWSSDELGSLSQDFRHVEKTSDPSGAAFEALRDAVFGWCRAKSKHLRPGPLVYRGSQDICSSQYLDLLLVCLQGWDGFYLKVEEKAGLRTEEKRLMNMDQIMLLEERLAARYARHSPSSTAFVFSANTNLVSSDFAFSATRS